MDCIVQLYKIRTCCNYQRFVWLCMGSRWRTVLAGDSLSQLPRDGLCAVRLVSNDWVRVDRVSYVLTGNLQRAVRRQGSSILATNTELNRRY